MLRGPGFSSSWRRVGRSALFTPSLSRHDAIGHCPPMPQMLTDVLCTNCGLCCDGTLFADVELVGRAEAARLEIMGMEIENEEKNVGLLSQPCAALRGT